MSDYQFFQRPQRYIFIAESVAALKSDALCVNIASLVVHSSRPIQGTVSVLLLYLFHVCVGKIQPTAFHFQKGRCVSTYTRSHFSKPTYNELCVTRNVLFRNKGHIDLTLSWCQVLSAGNLVTKSRFSFPVRRIITKRQKVYGFGQKTFRSQFTIFYHFHHILGCLDSQPKIISQGYVGLTHHSIC